MLENIPSLIPKEENDDLEKIISKEEIIQTMCGVEPYKAPDSDGFTIYFYRAYWNSIKKLSKERYDMYKSLGKWGEMIILLSYLSYLWKKTPQSCLYFDLSLFAMPHIKFPQKL
jgi:hypothetical protein